MEVSRNGTKIWAAERTFTVRPLLKPSLIVPSWLKILQVLHYIAVSVPHQKKGIARWALEHKFQEIDLAGKKTLLVATPMGQSLYKKLGFEEVDAFDIDLEKRGLKGANHWSVMVREPKAL